MHWPTRLARKLSISRRRMPRPPMLPSRSDERRLVLVGGSCQNLTRIGVNMRETVIVEAVRTAVGKRNGGLSGMHAADLSAIVLNELLERAGVGPEIVDAVIWGGGSQG